MTKSLQTTLTEIIQNASGKFVFSRMTKSFMEKNHPELVLSILTATSFYTDDEIEFHKRVLLILDGKSSRLTCGVCGCEVSPMKRGEPGANFLKFCSQKCSGAANKGKKIVRTEEEQSVINSKRESTMVEKYGVPFNTQREELKEEII